MPNNQRYAGTAVIERNSVPIRNELTSQLTRWKGIRGNMVPVDYSTGRFTNRSRKQFLFRNLVNASSFTPVCHNLLYHFRRLVLPKEYWSRWRLSNSLGKG